MRLAAPIRAYLRSEEYRDGLTVQQLSALCGAQARTVLDAVKRMPDAYIDRWVKPRLGPGRYAAVWCVVVPPENCPPPNAK